MLNKLLYDALEKLFGAVSVVSDGVEATVSPYSDGSGDWSIPQGAERGEQYVVNCPFCGDRKRHLYISYLSYARPAVNGIQLKKAPQMARCFRRECLQNPENRRYLEGRIGIAMDPDPQETAAAGVTACSPAQQRKPRFDVAESADLAGLRSWVPDWQQIDSSTDKTVLEYLSRRRVTVDDIDWLHIGWGPVKSPSTGRYINDGVPAVLMPIINNGVLKGVQARFPDSLIPEGGLKHWFHPGFRKTLTQFNLDDAIKTGIAVVCEGAFDVLSVGRPGVCCFGHTPSVVQMRMLSEFRHGIIWLPDTDIRPDLDTIEMARQRAAQQRASGTFDRGVHVVVLPAKDAGELTRQQVWQAILEQVSPAMQEYILDSVLQTL